jgi:hypothetical protein
MTKQLTTRWPVWPLPANDNHRPVLLVEDEHDPSVQIAYARELERETALVHSTQRTGLRPFFLPADTPVLAVECGRVTYAGKYAGSYSVVIEHPHKWLSYYGNLERLNVLLPANAREVLMCGDVIGYAGNDNEVRPIRFELWVLDDSCGYIPLDPIRFMHPWKRLPMPTPATNDLLTVRAVPSRTPRPKAAPP